MKTVAYVGPFSFPVGGPWASRVLGNALSLRDAGYNVIIGSGQMGGAEIPESVENIKIVSLNERVAENFPQIAKHIAYIGMGQKTINWLNLLATKPVAIILYAGYTPYLLRLIPWCRARGIPMAFDAVEWYSPERVPGGRFGPYRVSFEWAMRRGCVKCRNIISISSYIHEFYKQKGCNTIQVPPTLDTKRIANMHKRVRNNILRIGYTGSPGRKDLLNIALKAFLKVRESGGEIEFFIAGLDSEELISFPCFEEFGIKTMPSGIFALGRLSHEDALRIVSECDFTVLLRPYIIDTKAGFPTKVVESLAVGTPVICNLTSDLGDHIFHGKTGLICREPNVEACEKAFRDALKLTNGQLRFMREQSAYHAKQTFDYRNYIPSFANFVSKMKFIK